MAFNTAVHERTQSTPDILFLGREMKCPLAVRWDLGPVNSGQVDGGIEPFGPALMNTLNIPAGRLPRTITKGGPPIRLRLGIWLGIALRLLVPKCMACQLK